ncbi:MAG TPA: PASTA domain-containing protein [Bacteroidia bacterium]|nr:PASTA domain-containing protein [Bacteroidia bacterium]HRS58215.1 PASTA domain-containing protein [Bacteroidia bacterium]
MLIIDFLKSKIFLRNLLVFIIVFSVLIFSGLKFLKVYTHHGESLSVPDFKGSTIEEVEKICKEKNLRYEVIDSVYVPDTRYFTVVEQNPKPFSKVKRKRKIYLTICSDTPPRVKLPDIIDVTLRQAVSILQSYGLKLGELEYVPDIGKNLVLKVKKDGRILNPGDYVSKGSKIDLVLGDGLSSEKVAVIDVRGLTYDEAVFALSGIGLNVGAVILSQPVKDTSVCVVYKQYPEPSDVMLPQGDAVDIWLSPPDKLPQPEPK